MKKLIILSLLLSGCENVHTNLALINSRSPAINAVGTNHTEASTGFEGGGQLSPTVTPIP